MVIMADVELGKGLGRLDTLVVKNPSICINNCPIRINSKFKFQRSNGDFVVKVYGGITRDTPREFAQFASCCGTQP